MADKDNTLEQQKNTLPAQQATQEKTSPAAAGVAAPKTQQTEHSHGAALPSEPAFVNEPIIVQNTVFFEDAPARSDKDKVREKKRSLLPGQPRKTATEQAESKTKKPAQNVQKTTQPSQSTTRQTAPAQRNAVRTAAPTEHARNPQGTRASAHTALPSADKTSARTEAAQERKAASQSAMQAAHSHQSNQSHQRIEQAKPASPAPHSAPIQATQENKTPAPSAAQAANVNTAKAQTAASANTHAVQTEQAQGAAPKAAQERKAVKGADASASTAKSARTRRKAVAKPSRAEKAHGEKGIERKKHRIFPWFVLASLLICMMCAVSVFCLFYFSNSMLFSSSEEIELPNFTNLRAADIQKDERYSGLNLQYTEVYSSEKAAGIVISQYPRAPRSIKASAVITLTVSKGAEMVTVPDVMRETRDGAKEILRENGLNIMYQPVVDTTVPEGTVLYTEPTAGATVEAGETVRVYVAESNADTLVTVPQCVGVESLNAAVILLSKEGLLYDVESGVAEGAVMSQTPEAGTVVPRGSSVTLTFGGEATGLDALPQYQEIGADGHRHEYAAVSVVASNEYSVGYTIFSCSQCGYFYYGDYTMPGTS